MAKEPHKATQAELEEAREHADKKALEELQSDKQKAILQQKIANSMLDAGSIAHEPGDDKVLCSVPKTFNFTMNDHRRVIVPAGICPIPKALVEHSYMKNHGVKPLETAKAG
jgi:hypothetical protein